MNLYRVHAGHIRTWTGELEQFAEDTGAAWAAAIAAHGRALIAADGDTDDPEPHFLQAMAEHSRASRSVDQARTQLAYGEFLRRSRRRVDARALLRAALDVFTGETVRGSIVFVPVPGTDTRTVISSVVVAEGAFKGVGRFVEVVPGDPVSQDDLVSRGGTVHVVSTLGTLLPGSSINLHSCLFSGTQQLSLQVTGGTGQFADATGSFSGTVSGRALLARNPDGSCSFTQVPRLEVDKFAESGTLSF